MNPQAPLGEAYAPEPDPGDFAETGAFPFHAEHTPFTAVVCPLCQSRRVQRHGTSKRISALVGAMAGGISGGIKALEIARPYVGGLAQPRLRAVALASALTLGALAGASTGCAAGAALGRRLDAHVLVSYRCLDCGSQFSG